MPGVSGEPDALPGANPLADVDRLRDPTAANRELREARRRREQRSVLMQGISELSRQNTLVERAERIEREARERLRGVIEAREERIGELEEELAFYRNLVSPSEMEPGLQVRQLAVSAVGGAARVYRYELVLAQLNGSDRYAAGRIDLSVRGRRGRDDATLALRELVTDEEPETVFRFKYFQTLRRSGTRPNPAEGAAGGQPPGCARGELLLGIPAIRRKLTRCSVATARRSPRPAARRSTR